MLVLSRKEDEEVVIRTESGQEIVVTVVGIRCDRVRLGVAAPLSMTIFRREVQDAIDRGARS